MKKLFIANIPHNSDEAELKGLIEKKGYHVEDIYFPRTPDNGFKGFGYVRFSEEKEARLALSELNGVKLKGRSIRVDYADARQN